MKTLITAVLISLSVVLNAQVYSMQYTHFAKVDTISKALMSYSPYNTTIVIDYNYNVINIEDNYNVFKLNIVYFSGDPTEAFYECKASDGNIWKVSILSTKTDYLCVVTNNVNTTIYKKQH